ITSYRRYSRRSRLQGPGCLQHEPAPRQQVVRLIAKLTHRHRLTAIRQVVAVQGEAVARKPIGQAGIDGRITPRWGGVEPIEEAPADVRDLHCRLYSAGRSELHADGSEVVRRQLELTTVQPH